MSRVCQRQQQRHSGVTLIELLIVMAILVVISGLGMPQVLRMVERSRLTSAAKELQAELHRTRLESMKSGEPLVFHFELGTGNYEIMSKQEYDLRFPVAGRIAPFPPQMPFIPGAPLMGGMASSDMMMPGAMSENGQPQQAAGSTAPALSDFGSASLSDLVASTPQRSLSDYGGNAPTLADLGPPASLTDLFGEPDLQQIAAIPVSKFLPVYKTLPHDLRLQASGFGLQGGGGEDWLRTSEGGFGLQTSDFGYQGTGFGEQVSGFPEARSPKPEAYSEPIFFFPNGRTSNALFSVCSTSGKGYYMDVSVRGLTGTARLGELEVVR